jgi:hypothetical protein
MDKAPLISALIAELRLRYDRSIAALTGAREAATGADTKAENKYDTRGLEASYLAAGQAEQADELSARFTPSRLSTLPTSNSHDPIAIGAPRRNRTG